ncbi:MAG: hypothetical protein ABFS23_05180 [Pseudomonadota bacterium]
MKRKVLTALLAPPVGACRYACGNQCAAPITVFWLFGIVAVVYGLLGGPTGDPGIHLYTLALGAAMWLIASVWTLLTVSGTEEDRCSGLLNPIEQRVTPSASERDSIR